MSQLEKLNETAFADKYRLQAECLGGQEWVVITIEDGDQNEITYPLDEQTARLIAAAPALLEALQRVAGNGDMNEQAKFCIECRATMKAVTAAIAKAKGEKE